MVRGGVCDVWSVMSIRGVWWGGVRYIWGVW